MNKLTQPDFAEHGSIFLRVVLFLCGVVCALAALMFLFFWHISQPDPVTRLPGTEDKVAAIFFVTLLLVASVLSLVAAIRKK